jgi:hypothetical protein
VLLAVHARDDDEAKSAVEVLEKEGADRIDHIDANGKPLADAGTSAAGAAGEA